MDFANQTPLTRPRVHARREENTMIVIHHLGQSQSDRVVWLMEELACPMN